MCKWGWKVSRHSKSVSWKGLYIVVLCCEHGSTAQIQLKIPRAVQSQREGGVVMIFLTAYNRLLALTTNQVHTDFYLFIFYSLSFPSLSPSQEKNEIWNLLNQITVFISKFNQTTVNIWWSESGQLIPIKCKYHCSRVRSDQCQCLTKNKPNNNNNQKWKSYLLYLQPMYFDF